MVGEGTTQAMWGIIEKIKMFDRLAKSVVGGYPGRGVPDRCLISLYGARTVIVM